MSTPIKLSKRMKQLMAMLESGMSNKAIAEELELSEHTVKVHFWRMFNRIGVRSRLEAAKWWRDNQPPTTAHALRAAFDAACRLADQLKVDGGEVDPSEFEYHRAQVLQLQGAATC
jgi:ATP/maltotriose-dependent transcriptional regulator MalT